MLTPLVAHSAEPSSLWIGDSYTAGYHGGGWKHGEACVAAEAMDWQCAVDAQGGTGFLADGRTPKNKAVAASVGDMVSTFTALPARLAADKKRYPSPSYVVIDAGRNDIDSTALRVAVLGYLDAVHEQWPRAKLVVIQPYFITASGEALGDAFAEFYRHAAEVVGATVIDPALEDWSQPAKLGDLLSDDGVHPTGKGYYYLGTNEAKLLKAAGL